MSLAGPVLAIVGPTASGKSQLAEAIACALGSAVISVDAMQVYRGMDIGTAKIPVGERRCPLLMVDVVDVGQDYSVKLFQRDARACVDELLAAGRVPVLCGGTGLYLNAIIDDMRFPEGERGSAQRSAYEELLATQGTDALYELLQERDPESAAQIHPHNTRRVVRALELLDAGTSYARHHEGLHRRTRLYDARVWAIDVERPVLYERIDRRVDEMFAQGLVDEVERLRAQGLSRELTSGQAIGYKEVLDYLDRACDLATAQELIKKRTRHYAKRQLSWFRNDPSVRWTPTEPLDEAVARIIADLDHPQRAEEAL